MTAEPMGDAVRTPDPVKQRRAVAGSAEELVPREPFDLRLPIREITP
jgi:hypothetical protein